MELVIVVDLTLIVLLLSCIAFKLDKLTKKEK